MNTGSGDTVLHNQLGIVLLVKRRFGNNSSLQLPTTMLFIAAGKLCERNVQKETMHALVAASVGSAS